MFRCIMLLLQPGAVNHVGSTWGLQALWYYCQPPLASLQLLASISGEAAQGKLRGSALLNLLHQRSQAVAGDEQARRLLQKLLHAACAPYFR